jgi:hypothetical protein
VHLYLHLPAMTEHIMCKEFKFQFKLGGVEDISRRANVRDFEWNSALCQIPLQTLSVLQLSVV